MKKNLLVYERILEEKIQGHDLRQNLYKKIEKILGRPVISFYTNFDSSAILEDIDVDMLEQLLGNNDLSKGVTLLINSPGGSILAAERMIKTLQSYSGTKKYDSIIPKMAMSAAAMVCLGSDKLIMSPTSSLGPIDPQIQEYNHKTGQWERYSVFYILKSYKILFEKSANLNEKQNLEPFLQALDYYDPRKIEEYNFEIKKIPYAPPKTRWKRNS